jgi:hypothetical protein
MNDAQPGTQTSTSSEAATDGAAKDVEHTDEIPTLPPPAQPIDDNKGAFLSIGAVVAGVAAFLLAIRMIRLRRHEPTPQERLTEATQALGTAAAQFGGRAAKRTAEVAGPVAKRTAEVAGPAARRTVAAARPVAKDATLLAVGTAHEAAGLAADAAGVAAGVAVESARKVGEVAAGGVREVVEGVESVQKAWHKFVTRLIVVVFGGTGYVLGAKAGRERYDQIVGLAKQAQGRVQH